MSNTLIGLKQRKRALVDEMVRIAETAQKFGRELSANESRNYDEAYADVKQIETRLAELEGGEKRAKDIEDAFSRISETPATRGGSGHPLAAPASFLEAVQGAIDTRSAGRWSVEEHRATLVASTLGAPRAWGSNVLDGPRLLHVAAGVPSQHVDAAFAQHSKFTLPTASAGVGEGVTVTEFASSTAGSVTLSRFGRWTDVSTESQLGTDAGSIVGLHQLGVALDLDTVLVNAIESDAGTAVTFAADVPAAIRKSLATVQANTAAASVADLVILVHPDNIALLESVTPVGGETIAESFTRFSGALVYASTAVNTGFMTVCAPKLGVRYFEAKGLTTETDYAPKTAVQTIATSVIAGYGTGLVSGYAQMVDVVTP